MSLSPPAADPHAAYEAALAAQGYEPLPDFCVLDECKFHDRKTGRDVHLDPARLARMAESQNRRIEGRHAGTPVILGHTADDKPEGEQPEIVGMATRFRVAPMPDGTAGLWARPWAKKGHADTFKKNFRRSIELWLDPDAIDPIALLGPTTPRRDLPDHLFARQYGPAEATSTAHSAVRFSRAVGHGRHPILFEMRADMGQCDKCKCDPCQCGAQAPDDETVQKVANSAWGKQLTDGLTKILAFVEKAAPIFDQIEQEEEAGAGAPADAPPGAGAAPPGPPPAAAAPPPDEPPPDRDDGPAKKNSAGAAPGYGNTFMPSHDFAADRELRVRMQRLETEAAANRRAADEADKALKAANQKIQALQFARTSEQVAAQLDALERDGLKVVRDVDHPHLCAMPEADREKALRFMRDTRQKVDPPVPGGGRPLVSPEAVLQPFKFERAEAGSVSADPSLPPAPGVTNYADFARLAAEAKAKGLDPLQAYDHARLAPANGTAVR